MNRRDFLRRVPLGTVLVASALSTQLLRQLLGAVPEGASISLDAAQAKDWLARWEKNIVNRARSRYCDKEMGEELGWLVSPVLNGFHQIDVEGIVTAFEHGLIFKQEDIDRLISTNRDFMWNKQMIGAKFQRIDGGQPDPRWKNSPGVLWTALVAYDAKLREIFVANHDPAGWGGVSATPWFLSLNHT